MRKRQKSKLPILGINRSSPYENLKDGHCSQLHNLRYNSDAWRSVAPLKEKQTFEPTVVSGGNTYQILYKHPVTGSNRFIAISNFHTGKKRLIEVEVVDGRLRQTHYFNQYDSVPKITHYGNALVVRTGGKMNHYIYSNTKGYTLFVRPQAPVISGTGATATNSVASYYRTGDAYKQVNDIGHKVGGEAHYWRLINVKSGEQYLPVNDGNNDYWHGEIAVFLAFRMADGTMISPSHPRVFSSEHYPSQFNSYKPTPYIYVAKDVLKRDSGDIFIVVQGSTKSSNTSLSPDFYKTARAIPYIRFNFKEAENINTELITSVVLCSTRINPIYNYEKLATEEFANKIYELPESSPTTHIQIPFSEAYADNKLLEQPFYIVKEYPIEEVIDKNKLYTTVDLSYSLLKDIEHKPIYTPSQTQHDLYPNVLYDYNGRLHLADTVTTFSEGYPNVFFERFDTVNNTSWQINTNLLINGMNKSVVVKGKPSQKPWTNHLRDLTAIVYPDYRAKSISFYDTDNNGKANERLLEVQLQSSPANNLAYYLPKPTNEFKVPKVTLKETIHFTTPARDSDVLQERNRLQLSGLNNLIDMPVEYSYRIGSSDNEVTAIETIALELSDAKFGEFPLYLFTKEGIYAMQNGEGEVAYSRTIPVSKDIAINANTVSTSSQVFFITDRGVMAISGYESVVISETLNDETGAVPLSFLYNAKLFYSHRYNEIIVANNNYNVAYLLSLSNLAWSTRNFKASHIGGTLFATDNSIVTMNEEDPTKEVHCWLQTRPFDFGTTEFKRIETLIPRYRFIFDDNEQQNIAVGPAKSSPLERSCSVTLYGEVDGLKYSVLRRELFSNNDLPIIRRTPISSKSNMLRLSFVVNGALTLLNTDTELYIRHQRKLR